MRLSGVLFLATVLLGCGSGRPNGELNSCTGSVEVTEDNSSPQFGSVKYLGGTPVGQYMKFRTAVSVSSLWVSAYTNSATSFNVAIYKNHPSDSMPIGTQPLKQFTVTDFSQVDADGNLWLTLPEAYEFSATTEAEADEQLYYFVSLEPVGGTLVFALADRGESGRIRRGYREGGGGGSFGGTNTGLGFGFGFRARSNCQTER